MNRIRADQRNLKIERYLYQIAFTLFLIQTVLERIALDGILILGISISTLRYDLRIAALIFLVSKVIYENVADIAGGRRILFSGYLLACGLVILGYLTYRASGSNVVFWMIVLIACGRNINAESLAKPAFVIYTAGLVAAVSLALMGVVENYTLTRSDGTLRYAMGFRHPNSFGLFLFMICLSYCAMRYREKIRSEILLIGVSAALSYVVANSRTFTLMMCLLAMMIFIFRSVSAASIKMMIRTLLAAAGIGTVAASFWFMIFYTDTNTLFAKLNSHLSGRLYLSNLYYNECPLTLFGMRVSNMTSFYNGIRDATFMVDNAYVHLILRFGVLAAVLLTVGIVFFFEDQIRSRKWGICLFGFSLFLILGFSENMTIKFEYNYFLIALSQLLYPGKEIAAGKNLKKKKRKKRKKLKRTKRKKQV